MLVNTKAKVGVFSIALGAYLPQFPQLVPEFESQYAAFKRIIRIQGNDIQSCKKRFKGKI